MLATKLQAVSDRREADMVAAGTLVDTLLHFGRNTGGSLVCHSVSPLYWPGRAGTGDKRQ